VKPHTLSSFDDDLESIQTQIMRMGGLVEEAISKATEALVGSIVSRKAVRVASGVTLLSASLSVALSVMLAPSAGAANVVVTLPASLAA
jgi:hypothetical protein